ncbi:MAG: hypothetical protein GDA67_01780 [Nitrospira sp. CR1.3]|nr:hypothetical protein [Nitrospira sp. CR1.3]
MWRPREEWIEERVPQLRIVPDELWARAQERRRKVSESVAALRASLHCRARSTGRGPKYLFSGLLRCGVCRQPFVICESTKYGCSTFRTRGESDRTCSNGLKVERRLVESLLLAPIQRDLFTEEGFAVFKKEVARLLAEHRRTQKPDQEQAARQLKAVEREITAIMEAIKRGILTPTTKAALEKAEAERARLLPLVKARPVEPVATFLPNAIGRFRKLVEALGTVTPQQVDKARGILRELVGEIPLYPASDGAERYLTAELAGNYAGVVPLLGEAKLKLVAVTRIERVTRGL